MTRKADSIHTPALIAEGTMTWDRVYRHWLQGGGARALGPDASMCVLAVQSMADWITGIATISSAQIAHMTGVSERGVARAMKRAQEQRYLERIDSSPGCKGRWRVLRWVIARTQDGSEVPLSWPYIPGKEDEIGAAVKKYLSTGDSMNLPPSVTLHVTIVNKQTQIIYPGGIGIQIDQGAAINIRECANAWIMSLPPEEMAAVHGRTKTPSGKLFPPTSPEWKVAAWQEAGCPIPNQGSPLPR